MHMQTLRLFFLIAIPIALAGGPALSQTIKQAPLPRVLSRTSNIDLFPEANGRMSCVGFANNIGIYFEDEYRGNQTLFYGEIDSTLDGSAIAFSDTTSYDAGPF